MTKLSAKTLLLSSNWECQGYFIFSESLTFGTMSSIVVVCHIFVRVVFIVFNDCLVAKILHTIDVLDVVELWITVFIF